MTKTTRTAGVLATLAFVFAFASAPGAGVGGESDMPPDGVEQLLPRGGIPAIFEPQFVGASDASIPDDAWVFGVYVNGQAKAYDLNILNHHEIVNDVVGGKPVAPTW